MAVENYTNTTFSGLGYIPGNTLDEKIKKIDEEFEPLYLARNEVTSEIIENNDGFRVAKTIEVRWEKPENMSLYEFIKEFFWNLNKNYTTRYEGKYPIIHQCWQNRRRSLLDLYLICKSYFPECSLYDVIRVLYSTEMVNNLLCCICTTIWRRVYIYRGEKYTEAENTKDEWELTYNDLQKIANNKNDENFEIKKVNEKQEEKVDLPF